MKIKVHENTNSVYISTDHPKELYILGRIGAKLGKSTAYSSTDGSDNKELQLRLEDVINKLAE